MNGRNTTLTLLACCCTILTVAPSLLADFLRVISVTKTDLDTDFLCADGNGAFVPGPLTVCNVFAAFDEPDDRLLSVGNAELQVFNGQVPDVFYQHPIDFDVPYDCSLLTILPDLICDSYVAIGNVCDPGTDGTFTDGDWDLNGGGFNTNGRLTGGWFNGNGYNGQGDAGNDPPNHNLQVLILQSSVARGLSLSGDMQIFWLDFDTGDVFAEVGVPVECAATCGSCPTDADASGDTAAFDLALLLGSWGPVTSAAACLDADGDGIIGAPDLADLLGAWGPCPG